MGYPSQPRQPLPYRRSWIATAACHGEEQRSGTHLISTLSRPSLVSLVGVPVRPGDGCAKLVRGVSPSISAGGPPGVPTVG